ncbi:MAG: hypothetical protein DRP67_02490 [Candidatus Omnitrophota bacterium]|nr:MAG: hypothetical protein DRP67_02490 [Candidatus Omnitrophota bacterium]
MKERKFLFSLKDAIHFLYDITRYANLNIHKKKKKILSYILSKTVKLMNAKAGNIRLYEPKSESLVLVASYGTSKKYREEKRKIKVGESVAGVAFQKKKLLTVKDIRESKVYVKPELAVEKGMISLISSPLIMENKIFGIFTLYYSSPKDFSEEEKEIFSALSDFVTLLINFQQIYRELHDTYLGIINSLVIGLEEKDPYLKGHSEKVREYSLKIGKKIGLKEDELKILADLTILHDIGKLLIDSSILNKPGPLNEKEWEIIKKHPVIGSKILSPIRKFKDGIEIVRHHHERIDGKGYPDGISGEKISLLAKIVSAADAIEAMTSKRPYRKRPLTLDEVKRELIKNMGTQFDPVVVKAALELIEEGSIV